MAETSDPRSVGKNYFADDPTLDSGERMRRWYQFSEQDLDPDIRERPVLPYPGHGAERILLQVSRDLRRVALLLEQAMGRNSQEGDR